MSDSDDIAMAAVAAEIIIGVSQQDRRRHHPRRFWVRSSLVRGRKNYMNF